MDFDEKFKSVSKRDKEHFAEFKQEALAFAAIDASNPVAELLFEKAWEDGHAFGLDEVVSHLIDLSDIADVVKEMGDLLKFADAELALVEPDPHPDIEYDHCRVCGQPEWRHAEDCKGVAWQTAVKKYM